MHDSRIYSSLLALLVAGCISEGSSQRIEVVQSNDLGITTLTIDRTEQDGNQVFVLHALAASEREIASVRLTTGTIPGISKFAPGRDELGSELIVSVADSNRRIVSREMHRVTLDRRLVAEAPFTAFLALDAVTSALQREANMVVLKPSTQASNERPFVTQSCPSNLLLSSPTALQCCYDGHYGWDDVTQTFDGVENTVFALSDNSVVSRRQNPSGTGCKASDGVSSCSGRNCYFGPNGFSMASIATWESGWGPVIMTNDWDNPYTFCDVGWTPYPYSGSFNFPNVTGTFATGQGCPGGDSGDGAWDY